MDSPDSIAYYEHNAEAYARRSGTRIDLEPLERFTLLMGSGENAPRFPRVFDAGCGAGRDLKYFLTKGIDARGCDASARLAEMASRHTGAPVQKADLRLLSLAKGELDGIWAHRSLIHLAPDACRRVVASFFAALKPSGVLFLSMDEGEGVREDRADDPAGPARYFHLYRSDDVASLLRQHGFRILEVGKPTRDLDAGGAETIGYLARRI